MSKPTIEIGNVRATGGAVDFDATVAGYAVKLRMSDEFVADEIGGTDDARVRDYFDKHGQDIRDAAWARAYEHSTRDKKPGDDPGPVPYLATIRKPYDGIRVREG